MTTETAGTLLVAAGATRDPAGAHGRPAAAAAGALRLVGAPHPGGRGRRLEVALARWIASVAAVDGDPLVALLDRLGLAGRAPTSLAEAGRRAGLSGERVRQLEARLRERCRQGPARPELRVLDEALAAVARAVPVPVGVVGQVLSEAGLTGPTFPLAGLERAAVLLGRDLPFAVAGRGAEAVVLPKAVASAAGQAPRIEAVARRQAERCGAGTLVALASELAAQGMVVPRRHLRLVLDAVEPARLRADGWFWFADQATGPFVQATSRMLAVTTPLPVTSLHEGLRRSRALRGHPRLPPVAVLEEVYADLPGFRLGRGGVWPAAAAEPGVVGSVTRRIVEILRASPVGALGRAELVQACEGAGLKPSSVNLYASYSECLERVGPGLFAPRGAVVDPATLAVLKQRRRAARPDGHGPAWGWTADGRPWLEVTLTASAWANGVIHVPAGLRPALEGRRFAARGPDGRPAAHLGVDARGNSWGWTSYLRHAAARPGDRLRASFELSTGAVRLALVDTAVA